ncbi:uncharacterized protein MYCFIDRAFT_180242 [Pseudocercospora fijiensis CIRAD86]|uniref:Uncharacterized protein n=1 Tax=Pseudocercospora fijiensis (strain CIRAD86) TaxID=383855 RepID=M3AHV5_PSEFD|nr:uncharacterized protein MYCFIDRAFT_180242 [Pseudocercospora fijiensis CIRAD86]EME77097.1 hypothetical protein MYCFIDRAFT_180242 [Pseudocercospora fijiensis CIRAD86]
MSRIPKGDEINRRTDARLAALMSALSQPGDANQRGPSSSSPPPPPPPPTALSLSPHQQSSLGPLQQVAFSDADQRGYDQYPDTTFLRHTDYTHDESHPYTQGHRAQPQQPYSQWYSQHLATPHSQLFATPPSRPNPFQPPAQEVVGRDYSAGQTMDQRRTALQYRQAEEGSVPRYQRPDPFLDQQSPSSPPQLPKSSEMPEREETPRRPRRYRLLHDPSSIGESRQQHVLEHHLPTRGVEQQHGPHVGECGLSSIGESRRQHVLEHHLPTWGVEQQHVPQVGESPPSEPAYSPKPQRPGPVSKGEKTPRRPDAGRARHALQSLTSLHTDQPRRSSVPRTGMTTNQESSSDDEENDRNGSRRELGHTSQTPPLHPQRRPRPAYDSPSSPPDMSSIYRDSATRLQGISDAAYNIRDNPPSAGRCSDSGPGLEAGAHETGIYGMKEHRYCGMKMVLKDEHWAVGTMLEKRSKSASLKNDFGCITPLHEEKERWDRMAMLIEAGGKTRTFSSRSSKSAIHFPHASKLIEKKLFIPRPPPSVPNRSASRWTGTERYRQLIPFARHETVITVSTTSQLILCIQEYDDDFRPHASIGRKICLQALPIAESTESAGQIHSGSPRRHHDALTSHAAEHNMRGTENEKLRRLMISRAGPRFCAYRCSLNLPSASPHELPPLHIVSLGDRMPNKCISLFHSPSHSIPPSLPSLPLKQQKKTLLLPSRTFFNNLPQTKHSSPFHFTNISSKPSPNRLTSKTPNPSRNIPPQQTLLPPKIASKKTCIIFLGSCFVSREAAQPGFCCKTKRRDSSEVSRPDLESETAEKKKKKERLVMIVGMGIDGGTVGSEGLDYVGEDDFGEGVSDGEGGFGPDDEACFDVDEEGEGFGVKDGVFSVVDVSGVGVDCIGNVFEDVVELREGCVDVYLQTRNLIARLRAGGGIDPEAHLGLPSARIVSTDRLCGEWDGVHAALAFPLMYQTRGTVLLERSTSIIPLDDWGVASPTNLDFRISVLLVCMAYETTPSCICYSGMDQLLEKIQMTFTPDSAPPARLSKFGFLEHYMTHQTIHFHRLCAPFDMAWRRQRPVYAWSENHEEAKKEEKKWHEPGSRCTIIRPPATTSRAG